MDRSSPLVRLAIAAAIALPAAACGPSSSGTSSGGTTPTAAATPAAPAPITARAVCEHLSDLVAKELGAVDPDVRAQSITNCEGEMQREVELRGGEGWDLIARCVLDAADEAGVQACDSRYPAPAAAVASQPGREQQACDHMIAILLRDSGATPTDAERSQFNQECLVAFDEDRATMQPAVYDAMIDCLLAGQTMAALEQCGP